MKKLYMGPDGELFESDGIGRTNLRLLNEVSQEFACFRDAWYKSKINRMNDKGFSALTADDREMMKIYNSRPKAEPSVTKPVTKPASEPVKPKCRQIKFRKFGEKE